MLFDEVAELLACDCTSFGRAMKSSLTLENQPEKQFNAKKICFFPLLSGT